LRIHTVINSTHVEPSILKEQQWLTNTGGVAELVRGANDSSIPSLSKNMDDYATSYFIMVLVVVVMIGRLIVCCYDLHRLDSVNANTDNSSSSNEEGDTEAGSEAAGEESTLGTTRTARMSIEQCTVLYSEAFHRTKHQLLVHDLHDFMIPPTESDKAFYGDDDEDGEPDDSSIYLALEGARSLRQSIRSGASIHTGRADNNNGGDDDDSSSIIFKYSQRKKSDFVHPRSSIRHHSDSNEIQEHNKNNNHIVRGNCVICFDNILAGDTVVWSETNSCPHIYHKDCMVAFLAHRTQNKTIRSIKLDDNPCPTCRQSFITVNAPT